MMTLEERNKLAETIVATSDIWLLRKPYGEGYIDVLPLRLVEHPWTDRIALQVMAVKGKPFREKVEVSEGRNRWIGTRYKTVFPEYLEPVTPDKEGIGKKE